LLPASSDVVELSTHQVLLPSRFPFSNHAFAIPL
jgi:hypothetical protein